MVLSSLSVDWEKVGLILAVSAFGVGLWHLIEIRRVLREARTLKESLSTRYIGPFPKYYPDIANLLDGANEEIIIFCDFPAYAGFSDSRTWLRYRQTIERKLDEGLKIELTCLGEEFRSKCLNEQLLEANQQWDEWKQEPRNRKRVQALLGSHRTPVTIDELSKQQLLEMLADEDRQALDVTFLKATVKEVDVYMPMYFWLIDRQRAIFAIPSLYEKEYGFSTIDQKLIGAFIDMRDRYHLGIDTTKT
jgi:hypothetical protein